ncbi:hypothetical protein QJS10_CPB20g01239 [Acorus calamus]|uniref:VQ domain-containing protein n=1 Tax=Acorus calamus TaxID=4465 RepID=A0AAV9CB89_ACOCL|nr:hypothetical protein QJS10_CPB20g01239 [Acorus calamus]
MDYSKNNSSNNNSHLGVNKIGKNIRKSPLHQTNFNNSGRYPNQPPPLQPPQQPQVYNISKNDFRSIVQQLTGSPSRSAPAPAPPPRPPPPHNPPKPPSNRLQKIRPPPLTPIARPPPPPPVAFHPNPDPNSPFFNRPFSPLMFPPTPVEAIWSNTAESPISAYMRYLETSIMNGGGGGGGQHPQQPHQFQSQPFVPGILPTPPTPPGAAAAALPSPLAMPSPGGFFNMMSPLASPYRMISPRFQFPPPLTPNFGGLSPMSQSGILGPGPGFGSQQPPLSPGYHFPPPMSPSGFLPLRSPGWRD